MSQSTARIVPAEKEPTPPYQVVGQMVMHAPNAQVWETLADFHGLMKWTERVKRLYMIGEIERGPGAARRCEVAGLGAIDEIITVWDEGKRLGYRVSAVGPLGVAFSLWELTPINAQQTEVRLRLDYGVRCGSLGKLLHGVMLKRVLGANVPRVLSLLKRYVEETTS